MKKLFASFCLLGVLAFVGCNSIIDCCCEDCNCVDCNCCVDCGENCNCDNCNNCPVE